MAQQSGWSRGVAAAELPPLTWWGPEAEPVVMVRHPRAARALAQRHEYVVGRMADRLAGCWPEGVDVERLRAAGREALAQVAATVARPEEVATVAVGLVAEPAGWSPGSPAPRHTRRCPPPGTEPAGAGRDAARACHPQSTPPAAGPSRPRSSACSPPAASGRPTRSPRKPRRWQSRHRWGWAAGASCAPPGSRWRRSGRRSAATRGSATGQ